MIKLGLIGGIGSGKSTVTEMFCQLGAGKIDADQIGHEMLLKLEVKDSARERWGNSIFGADGELDRRKIAEIVFSNNAELAHLQSLTHPLIGEEVKRQLHEFEIAGKKAVILDIPLLLEFRWEYQVERIIFVEAPRLVRLARVLKRGWTEEEFDAREAAQLPIEEKRRQSDKIVDNSGNLDITLDQIKKIWQNLIP